jgi:predicted YcjX-like family ATPase
MVGAGKRTKFYTDPIPVQPPRQGDWGAPFLDIPTFEPPLIDTAPVDGIPHINLDLALDYLIGDRLR